MKVIKENERQKITLTEKDGKKFIERRIYDDKWEFYKILEKINHPNIPEIINVDFESDTVVTEEYIEGKSLNALMEENYVFSKKQIKSIVNQLVSAILELHKFNIIHRDIKPDNIIMNEAGHIWLIDYDIARIYRDEIRKDTESMGTFGYAPIEQYGIMPTDFKTDIYAFGMTLIKLLDYSGVKGSLYRIAKKCTRLDPLQRYKNFKELKITLNLKFLKNPFFYIIVLILIVIACVNIYQYKSTENYTFLGFEEYPKYTEYKDYPTFAQSLIFSTDESWEHLLFIDDVNMKGKIKLGRKNTRVKADITLDNGVLSVNLEDRYGNTFNHDFEFKYQYSYIKSNTTDLRKNADIICRDLDNDNVPELLIGLNECTMGVSGNYFYNPFNYCIGWCVTYDENIGFAICENDMFSEGQAFMLNKYSDTISVPWDDTADVMGYQLIDGKIQPI